MNRKYVECGKDGCRRPRLQGFKMCKGCAEWTLKELERAGYLDRRVKPGKRVAPEDKP